MYSRGVEKIQGLCFYTGLHAEKFLNFQKTAAQKIWCGTLVSKTTNPRRARNMLDTSTLTATKMKIARRDGTFGYKYFTSSGELTAKDCSMCRTPKPLSEFSIVSEKTSRDGRHSRCLDCTKTEQAKFRKKYEGDPTKDPAKSRKKNSSRSDEEILADQAAIHPAGTK